MSEEFYIDKYGLKRPNPPEGFIEFKVSQKDDGKAPICPNCNIASGFVYDGGGYTDNNATEFVKKLKDVEKQFDQKREELTKWFHSFSLKGAEFSFWDYWCEYFEGKLIKLHWSRFSSGHCMNELCNTKLWSDFVDDYVDIKTKQGRTRRVHAGYINYYKPVGVDPDKGVDEIEED